MISLLVEIIILIQLVEYPLEAQYDVLHLGLKYFTIPNLPLLLESIQLQQLDNIYTGQSLLIPALLLSQIVRVQGQDEQRHLRVDFAHQNAQLSPVVLADLVKLHRQAVVVDHVHKTMRVRTRFPHTRIQLIKRIRLIRGLVQQEAILAQIVTAVLASHLTVIRVQYCQIERSMIEQFEFDARAVPILARYHAHRFKLRLP